MLVLIGVLIVLGAAGYLAASAYGFSTYGAELRRRLAESQAEQAIIAEEAPIPPLMRRYAERAGGKLGGPRLFAARQQTEMRPAPDKPFFPLPAEQTTGTRQPGFVWTARGTMPPGLPVSAIDAYVAGAGDFEVRLLGAFPVATAGDKDAAVGELQRYLSELPLYPDAILNAVGLSWRIIDEFRIEVTAVSHFGPARVTFSFDDAGDIVGLEATRPRAVGNGKTAPTIWRGAYSDYRQWGEYRIPSHGEVGWQLPEGFFIYWRGDLVAYGPA